MFVPLWIYHVVGFVPFVLFTESRCAVFGHLLVVTGHLFIFLRLDELINWKWSLIFLPLYQSFVFDCSISNFMPALQVLLLGLKLDTLIHCSWFVVFLPTFIIAGFWATYPVTLFVFEVFSLVQVVAASKASGEKRLTESLFTFVVSVTFVTLLFGPSLLVALRLETYTFSTIFIVLPWLILIGGGLLWLSSSVCMGLEKASASNEDNASSTASYETV
ncbi:hypothetical protein ACHHYP_15925 [Achlya hypogyna]|uniref:Uncharacterized protein n=1 Tax=Achlya hypogyna TaxID=1202772 RepID=A0A1V9YA10_ACHHY|nr:hypothetical protein ACHHYP_15925 [Achlya hypogyna]